MTTLKLNNMSVKGILFDNISILCILITGKFCYFLRVATYYWVNNISWKSNIALSCFGLERLEILNLVWPNESRNFREIGMMLPFFFYRCAQWLSDLFINMNTIENILRNTYLIYFPVCVSDRYKKWASIVGVGFFSLGDYEVAIKSLYEIWWLIFNGQSRVSLGMAIT